jgi:hypothetical protein
LDRTPFLIATLLAALASLAPPAAAELPFRDKGAHLGVKTCAGTPCHGNVAALGETVLQNEHRTWLRRDAHARAYLVLLEDRSKRIARNLGLAKPAHESSLCLDCHADHVPPERRGPQFHLEDGVGCEGCHGGSEAWLRPHVSGASDHARNLSLGLYPTDDARARAELCISCHFGDDQRFVSHRMMGAGHPRLSFELDTFGQVQPRHHRVDEDYTERGKAEPNGAKLWALGQALLVREILEGLSDPERGRDGIWPEFAFFDCHACHHPMKAARWSPRRTTGLADRPGVARLSDSSFLMLYHAAMPIDPEAARGLRQGTLDLHAAISRGTGDSRRVADELHAIVSALIPKLEQNAFDVATVRRITDSLLSEGLEGEYSDYAGSEQATMALQALASALDREGQLDAKTLEALNVNLDRLLAATHDGDRFAPTTIVPILQRIRGQLR